eukprot:215419-Chlamydomonas_euryale.AAC.7
MSGVETTTANAVHAHGYTPLQHHRTIERVSSPDLQTYMNVYLIICCGAHVRLAGRGEARRGYKQHTKVQLKNSPAAFTWKGAVSTPSSAHMDRTAHIWTARTQQACVQSRYH